MSGDIEPATAAAGAAVTAGAGGFFWWLVKGIMTQRERAAEEFRQEVRGDLRELKAMMQASATTMARAEVLHGALEARVKHLERICERCREEGK